MRERGQTWIRKLEHGPYSVCVWVCLGDDRMLCIRENGQIFVTADAKGYQMDKPSHPEGVPVAERIT